MCIFHLKGMSFKAEYSQIMRQILQQLRVDLMKREQCDLQELLLMVFSQASMLVTVVEPAIGIARGHHTCRTEVQPAVFRAVGH